jgi:hypothetical protein
VIATGIITAPRPRSTLLDSLASYRRAGFENDVFVFCEPGVDPVGMDSVHMVPNEMKLGNLRNWNRALSILRVSLHADWFMICEDDISWAAGAADVLEGELDTLAKMDYFENVGGLSLYLPRRHSKHMTPLRKGWIPGGLGPGTWGFQCMIFSKAQTDWLLSAPHFKGYLANTKWDKNIDRIVGEAFKIGQKEILYRIPCLVDHDLGYGNSSLGYKDDRPDLKTDFFRGPRA